MGPGPHILSHAFISLLWSYSETVKTATKSKVSLSCLRLRTLFVWDESGDLFVQGSTIAVYKVDLHLLSRSSTPLADPYVDDQWHPVRTKSINIIKQVGKSCRQNGCWTLWSSELCVTSQLSFKLTRLEPMRSDHQGFGAKILLQDILAEQGWLH